MDLAIKFDLVQHFSSYEYALRKIRECFSPSDMYAME